MNKNLSKEHHIEEIGSGGVFGVPSYNSEVIWQSYDNEYRLQPVRVIMRDDKPVVQEERVFNRDGLKTWENVHWEDSKDPQIIQWALAQAAMEKLGLNPPFGVVDGSMRWNEGASHLEVFIAGAWHRSPGVLIE